MNREEFRLEQIKENFKGIKKFAETGRKAAEKEDLDHVKNEIVAIKDYAERIRRFVKLIEEKKQTSLE